MDENKPKSDPNANGEQPQRGFNPRVLFFLLAIFCARTVFEAAVALAIALNFYNNHNTIDIDRADELKG